MARGCALDNSSDDPDDPFDLSLYSESNETNSHSSSEIYVGADGCRHVDTVWQKDKLYTINSAASTIVGTVHRLECRAIFEMRLYLLRNLPERFPTSGPGIIPEIYEVPHQELAAWHCVFVLRPRSDQPSHYCDHPICPGAQTQLEAMWLSIETFMDWETLEPVESRIYEGPILAFKRNIAARVGDFDLKNFMPTIRMKFCFCCLEDLWARRHVAGFSPFTSLMRVKDRFRSPRHFGIEEKAVKNFFISPLRRAATERPHSPKRNKMRGSPNGQTHASPTPLDSESNSDILVGSLDQWMMDLDGVSSENEADKVVRASHNDSAGNEADVDNFSNDAPRAPAPKSWGNPITSISSSPANHQYISPYSLQLNATNYIADDEFPPFPPCKPRTSIRGLGITRREIRDIARRAGVMVSDAQREFMEKDGIRIPLRSGSVISLKTPSRSPVLSQPPTPSSVRRTSSLRSYSSSVMSSKQPGQTPQKRATGQSFGAGDEEAKRYQNSITARILREQETLKIVRGLERETKKRRTEHHNEKRRNRHETSQNENDVEELEKLYRAKNPKKLKYMANFRNNLPPFHANLSIRPQGGNQAQSGKDVLSFSQKFPPLKCYCRSPDDDNMIFQCTDLDCPGHRYHPTCLVGEEKVTCKSESWTCQLCKDRRAMEKAKAVATMDTRSAIRFIGTFAIEDITAALTCPGPSCGVRNPYGLGLATGVR
ncbi:hypothetical protein AOQ84DRAFT_443124 [Glonium stellatum]|uniref:Zinc finger PHD-type domain-containing protein n=1 Tax=Glonium stellatum TaxID=574774 RepID=A0A8E2EQH1_9PEZI|nr:hypothetical protein AOQ84DRAFT_443124 [Glonium stellatum]